MRCPACHDEYEDGVHTCARCGLELVPAHAAVPDGFPAPTRRRLGVFHPALAGTLTRLLDRRGVDGEVREADDGIEVLVDAEWRDDLRAELTLTWAELLRGLPEEDAAEVAVAGGPTPGWYDAPSGGYVDRAGRLVVDSEDEDAEHDATRMVGPALLAGGAILAVTGWYALGSEIVLLVGLALAVLGLLVPR